MGFLCLTREECDRLIRIIKSRVEDSAMAADTVDKGLIELPSRTIDSGNYILEPLNSLVLKKRTLNMNVDRCNDYVRCHARAL